MEVTSKLSPIGGREEHSGSRTAYMMVLRDSHLSTF